MSNSESLPRTRTGVATFGADGPDLVKAVRKAETTTQATDEGAAVSDWHEPPYNPSALASLVEVNETHAACVLKKSRYVAGFGFELVPREGYTDPEDESEIPEPLQTFWHEGTFTLGPDSQPCTAAECLETANNDYESVGWAALEILVDGTGTPVGLAHVPAHTIRKLTDRPGYVQLDSNGQPATYFGAAGDRYGESPVYTSRETGEAGATGDAIANELLIYRNYNSLAPHYGTPDVLPAISTIQTDVSAREYNARFFESDGTPRFVVSVEGGELTDRAYTDLRDTLQEMRDPENAHRAILLEAANGIESQYDNVSIEITPLQVGIQEDASFIELRKECEHDITKAHEVPKFIIGRDENVNYNSAQQQRKLFLDEVIKPRQERFAERLYQALHVEAFGLPEWDFSFNLAGTSSRQDDAEVLQTRMNAMGDLLTINEARAEAGMDPLDSPAGEVLVAQVRQGSIPDTTESEEVEAALRAQTARLYPEAE